MKEHVQHDLHVTVTPREKSALVYFSSGQDRATAHVPYTLEGLAQVTDWMMELHVLAERIRDEAGV